jgi:hypothetical protein
MTTPEGRQKFLDVIAKHPKLINSCDKHHKSGLYRATEAGDLETMTQIIKAGIMPYFFHDAIYAAAQSANQPALDLLLRSGGVVGEDHVDVVRMMSEVYTEPGPEGEPHPCEAFGKQCCAGLDMLKAAREKQEIKRAEDEELKKQVGPLVLTDAISVRGPLRFRPSGKAKWSVFGA